jgi:transcription-repair coupling factor (superfamily II helicase)
MSHLLIVGLHPRLLEKTVVWFEKQTKEILRARHLNAFWRNHTIVCGKEHQIKLSEFVRALTNVGYVKIHEDTPPRVGTFSQRGGEIIVFPINKTCPQRIEFLGNTIESITELSSFLKDRVPVFEYSSRRGERSDGGVSSIHRRTAEDPQQRNIPNTGALREGDFVVHIDHGIGIFRGVEIRNTIAYLSIEYAAHQTKQRTAPAKHDMLYVPEEHAKKISPYLGFRKPTIHRLGTPIWNNTKRKVKEDIIALAKNLLATFASREIITRVVYERMRTFENDLASSFPYEETPDQLRAIEEIYEDMAQEKPMDRLLCADVGFGKTEVALRAAFHAVCNKRQVAFIAPTTILAEQHFQTCVERFRAIPVSIERLTRLENKNKQRDILHRLKIGRIDIIIGTHRLLSRDVLFHNVGLLILDEEQRFGVKQKEHIKSLQNSVDILSLSATPIPRTMHLALANIRSLSTISTPPPSRIPPKTFVLPFSKKTITQALEAELSRGGQVYILSNYIRKLPLISELIREIAPHANISTLHGRMSEKDIITTMHNFRARKTNVLIATTIIENGLDISNANTLIIENATRIGLSQAHQLRGRIGRGTVQSYAYFLYPTKNLKDKAGPSLPVDSDVGKRAAERLEVLMHTQHLGAGQEIARRDLEIRGAGNILGSDQSGRVNQIGLNLYCQMLAEAVESLRE